MESFYLGQGPLFERNFQDNSYFSSEPIHVISLQRQWIACFAIDSRIMVKKALLTQEYITVAASWSKMFYEYGRRECLERFLQKTLLADYWPIFLEFMDRINGKGRVRNALQSTFVGHIEKEKRWGKVGQGGPLIKSESLLKPLRNSCSTFVMECFTPRSRDSNVFLCQ